MDMIGGEVVIANLFTLGQVKVEFRQLHDICRDIERNEHKRFRSIYLDITSDHLLGELPRWPKLFKLENSAIYRGTWNDPEASIRQAIKDTYLPEGVKDVVIDLTLVELPVLEPCFQEIFTTKYVAEAFNWRIPEDIREEFLELIRKNVIL